MIVVSCLCAYSPGVNATPTLSSSAAISTAGYFRLGWSSASQDEAAIHYELQQAGNQQFTRAVTIYEGPDRASVVSGLADQVYFFRVREKSSPQWSAPVRVEVKHHSLTRAFGFFGLGAVIFAIMIGVLLKGTHGEASP